MEPLTRELMGPSLGEHSIGCLAGMVPARIEGSEGRFRPTPEAPPACWRVKDWLGRGILAIVAVIMLRRNVPRGSVLLWRLSQRT